MLNHTAATARIGREIVTAEQDIADALVSSTALLHSCALAARDNPTKAASTQAAFLRAHKAASSLIEARGEMARTHASLLDVYRETAGPAEPYPCPDDGFTSAELGDDKVAA